MVSGMVVEGNLDVEGSEEEPVRFTGAHESEPGEWTSIAFEPGSGGTIDHAEFAYGGGPYYWVNGMVEIFGASPTITHSVFRHSQKDGISVRHGGSPDISENIFLSCGWGAISYYAASGYSGEVNIHGNYADNSYSGIQVTAESAEVIGTNLSGNTVVGGGENPLTYDGTDIPDGVTANFLSENVNNAISIGGLVKHSVYWGNAGSRVRFSSHITVSSGRTLTIGEGLEIANPAMTINGNLDVEGSEEEPVRFTGAHESEPGEWTSIAFEPGSGGTIDHAEFAYGGGPYYWVEGMIEIFGASPTIRGSTFLKSRRKAIYVASGTPVIEGNRFRENGFGLRYAGSGSLSAPNNDWDCPSGPRPAGCGDEVSENVDWKPAVVLPEQGGHCRGKEGQCGEGADPVSLATGQLDYSHRDLVLPNKSSQPLEFTRAYSSGSDLDAGLGPGWSQTGLASASEFVPGEVLVQRSDGRQDVYRAAGGGYDAPSGVTDILQKVEGNFRLTTLEGSVYRFDESGRIVSITDDHGLETTYGYSAAGRLATITDPSGQTLSFSYDGTNHITAVKDSTGREVVFTYDEAGNLATTTDALGGTTNMPTEPITGC